MPTDVGCLPARRERHSRESEEGADATATTPEDREGVVNWIINEKMRYTMRKLIFLFILMLTVGVATKAADVTFKASAPQAVVMGEQFRLTFTVNAEGKDLRVQEMPDFDVLMGPSQSTSYSSSWVNGKSTSETTVTYTYV